MRRFKAKNPLVPLQGLLENHILAVRPTKGGQVRLLEDCEDATTKQMLENPKLRRYPPGKGIATGWAEIRDKHVRELYPSGGFPKPDWEKLRDNKLCPDDLPALLDEEENAKGPEELTLLSHLPTTILPRGDLKVIATTKR